MDIFERASRSKLRFETSVGNLTTEQLWDLPLTVRGDRPDLDRIARTANAELKSLDEGSFVNLIPDPRRVDCELRLEIAKHIIAIKIADANAAKKALETAVRKRKLIDALAAKDDATLINMSREDIEAEIAKLST
jgi:hypothetical protein